MLRARSRGAGDGDGLRRDNRPRRHVRLCRVLQCLQRRRSQADTRLRGLRRPERTHLPRRQGAEPPHTARRKRRGLLQPHEARLNREHRRLLLQAAHRPRPSRALQQGADMLVGLPRRRDTAAHHERRHRGRGAARRHVQRHNGEGEFLPRGTVEQHTGAGARQQDARRDVEEARPSAHRDERLPLHEAERRGVARHTSLCADGQPCLRRAALPLSGERLLLPLAGGDVGDFRKRPSGVADQHAAHRRPVQRKAQDGPLLSAGIPAPRGRDAHDAPAQDGRRGAAPQAQDRKSAAELSRTSRIRARHNRADGLPGIFLHSLRHHSRGEVEAHTDRAGTRLRGGLARRLLARHHRPRPDTLQSAI